VKEPGWAGVGWTAVAKVAVMGLSGLLGIFTSRLIITEWGVDSYAQYGLISSLSSLLPFADLGMAAVVINVVAQSMSVRLDEEVLRTLTSAFRVLFVAGAIIAAVAVVIGLAGLWPVLLGAGLDPNGAGGLAATLSLVIFGLVLPLTVGQRILVGLGRTPTQVASQAVFAPFVLVVIGACALLSLPVGDLLPIVPYLGNGLVSVLCLIWAARAISPQVGGAFRRLLSIRRHPGVPVMHLAWPMLVQMVALPIALQTDRIIVSQLSGVEALAEYNLAAQFFGIVLQTIAAAGVALWPIFARARATGTIRTPTVPALVFLGGGLVLGIFTALLIPWLSEFVSDGEITVDSRLITWFVVFVAFQSVKYPLGMYMTDKPGLRFQVVPTILMIPVSIGRGIWLVPTWGGAGAIAGSAVAVALLQVAPGIWYVARDVRRRMRSTTTAV
jgi:Na+-driven multidrug efflux pump